MKLLYSIYNKIDSLPSSKLPLFDVCGCTLENPIFNSRTYKCELHFIILVSTFYKQVRIIILNLCKAKVLNREIWIKTVLFFKTYGRWQVLTPFEFSPITRISHMFVVKRPSMCHNPKSVCYDDFRASWSRYSGRSE